MVVLTLLAALIFAIRLAAPPNLLDQDQERPATYVLDAVKNGHWLCQRDLSGDVTSKPPLYTWLVGGITLLCGRINEFALYLPGALSLWGCAMLIYYFCRPYFGSRAAFCGAVALMVCTSGIKEAGLARTDGVFSLTVTAAAVVAFRSWTTGRGWIWFWVVCALSTLTKGPVGPVLAAGGLLAHFWERKSHPAIPNEKLSQRVFFAVLPGVCAYVAITLGWFLAAYAVTGPDLTRKMIGKELVDHATGAGGNNLPGTLIYQQPLYYLARTLPWSVFAYFGLWQIWRNPSPNASVRRWERFLFCWFLSGLLLMSLAPHQRADLLWPLMPAAAALAGCELDRLGDRIGSRVFNIGYAVVVIGMVAGYAFAYFGPLARLPLQRETLALKRLASQFEARMGRDYPLEHLDSRMGLQVYLNTFRQPIPAERAVELLRGKEPCFLAVRNLAKLEAARKPDDPPYYTVLAVPSVVTNNFTRIIGNRPTLEPQKAASSPKAANGAKSAN